LPLLKFQPSYLLTYEHRFVSYAVHPVPRFVT